MALYIFNSTQGKTWVFGSKWAWPPHRVWATKLNTIKHTYDVVLGPFYDDFIVETEIVGTLPIVAHVSLTAGIFVQLNNTEDTLTFISQSEGKHIGLNDKLLGAIGTTKIPLTPFWRMGPPAESEYAVDPVEVEMRIPSPAVEVRYSPLTQISSVTLYCDRLEIYTSLIHTFTTGGVFACWIWEVVAYSRINLAISNGISILPQWC